MEKLPLRSFGTTEKYESSILSLVTNIKTNIMSEIIKLDEDVNLEVMTTFTKDLGLFQVKAMVYSCVTKVDTTLCLNYSTHEINDIELTFSINNKECRGHGFKELYQKLYGEDTFYPFCSKLRSEFEDAYFKLTSYQLKNKL
jgi:hypothetical protein